MKKILTSLFLLAMLCCDIVQADYCFPVYAGEGLDQQVVVYPVNFLTLSPTYGYAYLKQDKCKEKGSIYGIIGNYDIIAPESLYLGVEVGYRFANLNGCITHKDQLTAIDQNDNLFVLDQIILKKDSKSKYDDLFGDLKVGYTLGTPLGYAIPYLVFGGERENQEFIGDLKVNHLLKYLYFGVGAKSNFVLSQGVSLGLNAKFKWMFNSNTKTIGDLQLKDKSISAANRFHWEVEAPISFILSPMMTFAIVPYYQYKNYDRGSIDWIGSKHASFSAWGGKLDFCYSY